MAATEGRSVELLATTIAQRADPLELGELLGRQGTRSLRQLFRHEIAGAGLVAADGAGLHGTMLP